MVCPDTLRPETCFSIFILGKGDVAEQGIPLFTAAPTKPSINHVADNHTLRTEMVHLNKTYQTLCNTTRHEDVVLALDQMEGEK